jgi:Cytochrome P460
MRFFPALLLSALLAAQIQYTPDSKLSLPKDYREWIFLTSGLGMSYAPAAKDSPNPSFDNVFVNPSSYQSFLKTGTWPDKTVLVLELRGSDNHASITTAGRSQTTVTGIEVHVKDSSKGGWSFYNREGTLFPKTADCYSCHEKNGSVDTTFVQYYPTLIDTAKSKGTYKQP